MRVEPKSAPVTVSTTAFPLLSLPVVGHSWVVAAHGVVVAGILVAVVAGTSGGDDGPAAPATSSTTDGDFFSKWTRPNEHWTFTMKPICF